MKSLSIKTFRDAVFIIIISTCLGLIVNLLHPKSIKIVGKRPALQFAPDTVLAQDLPGVSLTVDGVKAENESAEPLFITTAQALQLKKNNQLLFLDARTEAEFSISHLPGAQNLPYKNLVEFKTRLDSLPQDKWLVCYCDGPPCDQSESLAHELIIAGYELVAVYFDGLNGWKKLGYDIEGKEVNANAK